MQDSDSDVCGVTLAIVMELCRLGSFYKLIEQARHVVHLPPDVRSGAACPTSPEMAKVKVSHKAHHRWTRAQIKTDFPHASSLQHPLCALLLHYIIS